MIPATVTKRRRAPAALAAVAALALAGAIPRTARAELTAEDVKKIVDTAKAAYGYYGLAISLATYLLGDKAPSLAQQLNDVKASIIGELRTQRNLAWKEEAQDAFDDFAILAVRPRTDSQNETLRWAAWQLSQGALNYYAGLVEAVKDGLDDIGSAYQLAPTFNMLLVVHTGLTRMRAEITPANRVPWGEFDIYLKRGMQVNYTLIGARLVLCWPGYNPGAGQYAIVEPSNRLNNTKLFTRSQLWKKRNWQYVDYKPAWTSPCRPLCYTVRCQYHSAATYPRNCDCMDIGQSIPVSLSNSCKDEAMAWTVDYVYTNRFSVNGVVRIIRASMGGVGGILKVGGGDDRWDGPNLSLPEQGRMTDPWVDESLCTNMPGNGGNPNPWAYPLIGD